MLAGVSSDRVEMGGLNARKAAISARGRNKAVVGSYPNAFRLKEDATEGGQGSELGSPGSGVCIYHDASPGVWRLLTAPGHVSRGDRGKDRRREDVEARLHWGEGGARWRGGTRRMWLGAAPPPSLRAGKPRPQPSPIPEAAREQLWSSAWCT